VNGVREPRGSTVRGSALANAARATGWTLGAWAAMQVAGIVLTHSAIAALAVQAAIAEWAAGKLAVTWSDPLAPMPSAAAIRRRLGVGAAFGVAAAGLVIGLAVATRQASIEVASPALGSVLLGVLAPVLAAVRDELLLRGMVLKVGRALTGHLGAIALCGCAAAAVRAGGDHPTVLAIGAEGLRAVALAFVWTRDRGAWMALGANAVSTWVLDSVTRGDLLDVRMGAGDPASGVPAFVVVAAAAAYAAWWGWPRRTAGTERAAA
jgi:hypothetical protein